MIDISTGKEMTRRDFGRGLSAIIAAGVAPSIAIGALPRGLGARCGMMVSGDGGNVIVPNGVTVDSITFSSSYFYDGNFRITSSIYNVETIITPQDPISENAIIGSHWSLNALFFMSYNGYYRFHYLGKMIDMSRVITNVPVYVFLGKNKVVIGSNEYQFLAGSTVDYSETRFHIGGLNAGGKNRSYHGKVGRIIIRHYSTNEILHDYVPCVISGEVNFWDVIGKRSLSQVIWDASATPGDQHEFPLLEGETN